MNIAVILAGGVGNRVGASTPKQFIEILGKPIIAYTIEPFEKHSDVDVILIVCLKSYIDYVWQLKYEYNFTKLKWVTEGGATFQESVLNGVNFLRDKIKPDDTVLFHFGASPFVKEEIITDVIRVCKEKGTNAISTTDYLLLSGKKKTISTVNNSENYTDEYIDRNTIAVMNTPHAFQFGFISDLYKDAVETGIIKTVEPHTTTLMYAMGKKIYFSKGSQCNIKITTKEDLELFEGYVLEQQRKSKEQNSGDVVVFLADGFEECEGLIVVDILRRAGLSVIMASITGSRDVKSSREILIRADCLAEYVDYEKAKMIVLPGGRRGTENLRKSKLVKDVCTEFSEKAKYIAAICAAPSILASWGLLNGKKATCHPDFSTKMLGAVVSNEDIAIDGNAITGRGLGSSISFALTLVRLLIDKGCMLKITEDICYENSWMAGDLKN